MGVDAHRSEKTDQNPPGLELQADSYYLPDGGLRTKLWPSARAIVPPHH